MINVKNTYFGFTEGKKPLQAGKIEKSLDMLFNYDGKIMTAKENVFIRMMEGYRPEVEENHSYYSPRIDGYTKPKTLYKLQKEGSYYEINKTLYEYAVYLLKNEFLNEEIAKAFIFNEVKTNEENERMEQERIKKEREESEAKRQKEEEERKRILNEKRTRWIEKGNEFMTNATIQIIKDTVESHWNRYEVEAGDDEKDRFVEQVLDRMPEKLGNLAYVTNILEWSNEKNDLDYFHIMNIEAEIFIKVFDVQEVNGIRRLRNKVKAAFA